MPYEIFSPEVAFNQEDYNIEQAMQCIENEKDKQIFFTNIEEWGLMTTDRTRFEHLGYSKKYIEQDVKVLSQGVWKFRDTILEQGVDIRCM